MTSSYKPRLGGNGPYLVRIPPKRTSNCGIARRVDVIVIMCLLDLYVSVDWFAAERKQLVQDPIEVRIWRNAER